MNIQKWALLIASVIIDLSLIVASVITEDTEGMYMALLFFFGIGQLLTGIVYQD